MPPSPRSYSKGENANGRALDHGTGALTTTMAVDYQRTITPTGSNILARAKRSASALDVGGVTSDHVDGAISSSLSASVADSFSFSFL